jgi:predicted hotdog family 3-hydroxylacyl-ACP dehydratase
MIPPVPDFDSLTIETLLPHRGRMLLVDEILEINERQAKTLSVVREGWPLFKDGFCNPLILIELVAQTSGIHNGLTRLKERGVVEDNGGWLVGVKRAVFHTGAIARGKRITTTAKNAFVFDDLREIAGSASIDGAIAAEVVLQVMEAK